MSDPFIEQARALASLSAENGLLRAEIERLKEDRDNWRDVCLGALKEQFRLAGEIKRLTAAVNGILGWHIKQRVRCPENDPYSS